MDALPSVLALLRSSTSQSRNDCSAMLRMAASSVEDALRKGRRTEMEVNL